MKPFFLDKTMLTIQDKKSQFIFAVKRDLEIKIENRKSMSDFFSIAVRKILGVPPNSIRASVGIGKGSADDNDIEDAITWIMSNRPVTFESVKTACLRMRDKCLANKNRLSTAQKITATGITRFMALSRKSMKYGPDQLSPYGIVAELQNDYVTRVQVSRFSSKSFYKSREWKELRLAVLSVCDRCVLCGAGKIHGAVLHVDHIKPRSLWPELSLDMNNMQVLCGPCNMAKSNVLSEKY